MKVRNTKIQVKFTSSMTGNISLYFHSCFISTDKYSLLRVSMTGWGRLVSLKREPGRYRLSSVSLYYILLLSSLYRGIWSFVDNQDETTTNNNLPGFVKEITVIGPSISTCMFCKYSTPYYQVDIRGINSKWRSFIEVL